LTHGKGHPRVGGKPGVLPHFEGDLARRQIRGDIARIVPAVAPEREAARQRLLDHLRSLPAMHAGPFDRDEAYE